MPDYDDLVRPVALRDRIPADDPIADVKAATIRAALPNPIVFGDWVIAHREFVVVRLESQSGAWGVGFTLTRDGPVAAVIRDAIAASYLGKPYDHPERLFSSAQLAKLSILISGVGLRGLSIVDLATWDLAARSVGVPIGTLLMGSASAARLPVTGIVGYPPTIGPEQVEAQVGELYEGGWRRFKLPVAATPELTRARFEAAHSVADDVTVAMDAAWVFRDVDAAAALVADLEHPLEWYEDVFPPGDAAIVRALRDRVSMPVAMGDEQGGAYFPEALLLAGAVDIVRLDATCMGGITRLRPMIELVEHNGKRFTPHMFSHAHQPVLAALGHGDAPIEWGIPGTGVDPYADSLPQPRVQEGRMDPLEAKQGFGAMASTEWIAAQEIDDPDGLLDALTAP